MCRQNHTTILNPFLNGTKIDGVDGTCKWTLKVHSRLRFIRRDLLRGLFSPHNYKKLVHNPLLNFSVHAKVYEKANVNVPTGYSTTHYPIVGSSSQYISMRAIAGDKCDIPPLGKGDNYFVISL